MTRRLIALSAALLALAVPSCSDDEGAARAPAPRTTPDRATTPRETSPRTAPAATPAPGPSPTAPVPTTTGEDPRTAPLAPGEGDGTGRPPSKTTPDGPGNDSPPPAGTPAEAFERSCEAGPDACG